MKYLKLPIKQSLSKEVFGVKELYSRVVANGNCYSAYKLALTEDMNLTTKLLFTNGYLTECEEINYTSMIYGNVAEMKYWVSLYIIHDIETLDVVDFKLKLYTLQDVSISANILALKLHLSESYGISQYFDSLELLAPVELAWISDLVSKLDTIPQN